MKSSLFRLLVGLAVVAAWGCGSGSDFSGPTGSTGGGEVITANRQIPKVDGVWSGQLGGNGGSLQLFLNQSGSELSGDATIVRGSSLIAIRVLGNIGPDGLAEFRLDGPNAGFSLPSIRFADEQGEASVSGPFLPGNEERLLLTKRPRLTGSLSTIGLWNNRFSPFSTVSPTEKYDINGTGDGKDFNIEVELVETSLWEFVGTWEAKRTTAVWNSLFRAYVYEGKVSAGVLVSGDWARITLKDDVNAETYGTIWFLRHINGVIDSTSQISEQNSTLPLKESTPNIAGTVTLRQR